MSGACVAFAGLMASGKSTISRKLAEDLGWTRVSFGDEIRTIARERGLGDGLDDLQALGEELVARDPGDLCRRVLDAAAWSIGMPLIVDGIRHRTVLSELRVLIAPDPVQLVYVGTPLEVRRSRLKERGVVDIESVMAHSTERDAATRLREIADLTVRGDADPRESASHIRRQLHLADG